MVPKHAKYVGQRTRYTCTTGALVALQNGFLFLFLFLSISNKKIWQFIAFPQDFIKSVRRSSARTTRNTTYAP